MNIIDDYMFETAIETATGPELTLLLYNGAIRFTNEAMEKLDEGCFDEAGEAITKTANIIQELQIALDHKYAISESLNDLYRYMFRRLCTATVDESASRSIVAEVRDMLREFRDTWKLAMQYATVATA